MRKQIRRKVKESEKETHEKHTFTIAVAVTGQSNQYMGLYVYTQLGGAFKADQTSS